MAAAGSIRVEGLNKFVRDLKQFSPDLAAELKVANREIAEGLVPVARGFVPQRTGRLAASIRAGASGRSGVVRAGNAAVPYAGPIHFGWPGRNIKPQPFLYDALDSRRDEIIDDYMRRVTKLAERI